MGYFDNFPDVSFIDESDDTSNVIERLIASYQQKYKELTGKDIALAQANPYRLIMLACGEEIGQVYQKVNRGGRMNLLKYSYGDYLDDLGLVCGLTRRDATPATTVMRFSIASAMSQAISIPAGTRTTNGAVFFETTEYAEIPIGSTYVDVPSACTVAGTSGNGFSAGEINTLAATMPYISAVSNQTTTENGADVEADEEFAERIYLAPNSFSVAGSVGAYEYWTKAFSTNIGDVRVTSPDECEVNIYVVMKDGSLPSSSLIDDLEDYLSDAKIRPLTDHVTVLAPTQTTFNITLTYYIASSDTGKAVEIQAAVSSAVDKYVAWQCEKIGRDVNPSELIRLVMEAGAKRVVITYPVHTTIDDTHIAALGTKTVTYGGIEND